MENEKKQKFISDAKEIHQRGWRQGSLFSPCQNILKETPGIFEETKHLLIIVSQSCSVVSSRFDTDPLVEAMIVKKLEMYERNTESIGKNQRILHLKLRDNSNFQAVECSIHKRFFFERRGLISFSPSNEFILASQEEKKLAAWIGRNYTRIALPEILANRMSKNLLPVIKKELDRKLAGKIIYTDVINIYINWEPRNDDAFDGIYKVSLIFICNNQDISGILEENLKATLGEYMLQIGKEGIKVVALKCAPGDQIFLSDLQGYDQLSEWDYLTNLAEIKGFI